MITKFKMKTDGVDAVALDDLFRGGHSGVLHYKSRDEPEQVARAAPKKAGPDGDHVQERHKNKRSYALGLFFEGR